MKYVSSLLALLVVVLFVDVTHLSAKVEGRTVEYTAEGTTLKGYLAYDQGLREKRPAVLVVHEWWGLNDYARKRADMLAGLGYIALAVDMYGEGKTAMHPDDAKKFSSEMMKNFDVSKARFLAAMEYLKSQPLVDATRIAAIGYCFGGGIVLNMARQGLPLRGVASFHGSLAAVKPAGPGEIKAKVLVLNGADDKFVPAEQIEAFRREMEAAGANYTFINYPGAVHSFTVPEATEMGKRFNMPLAYNEKADKASWKELRKFLKAVFK